MSEFHIKLGKLLKAERERQGRHLHDLSHDLKISEAHLQAIESGDIGEVPSELYFKLFAKSYAEALGLNYVNLVDSVRDDTGEEGTEPAEPVAPASVAPPRPGIRTRPAEPHKRHTGTWFLIGLAIVILGGLAWLLTSTSRKDLFGGKAADSTQATDTAQAEDKSDTGYTPGTGASRENSKLNLDLIARDRTWAVVIADGDTALQTNLKPWREYYVGAQESLVVSIGSPLSVEVMLNGTAANLKNPEDLTISQVVITPDNSSMFIERSIADSADSARDTSAVDSLSGDITGTGSSPTRHGAADTSSTSRGTADGT